MPLQKKEIEDLFSVGDTVPCGAGEENALCISSMLDDRIQLRPVRGNAGEISLEYGTISDALAEPDLASAGHDMSPLRCFVSEHKRRAQIRREEQVNALWHSASELFLGPVCGMNEPEGIGNAPYCPFDADFFLKRG